MRRAWIGIVATSVALYPGLVPAREAGQDSPEADSRTYIQNFKDMVLAEYLATAYKHEPGASKDIGSRTSALRDWTYYDLEKAPDVIHALVADYLARDYRNPIVESEVKGVKFDLLKCLDLYHSKRLDADARKLVLRPNSTYRTENPQKSR